MRNAPAPVYGTPAPTKIKRKTRSVFRKQVIAILREMEHESAFKHAFPEAVEALVKLYA